MSAGSDQELDSRGTDRRAGLDRSLEAWRKGYRFLPDLRREPGAEPVLRPGTEIRLLGKPALVVGGEEGAELFYDATRMQRTGALPRPLQHVLFGDGAVHGLDGEAHRRRKAMFLSLLDPVSSLDIAERTASRWRATLAGHAGEPIEVFDTAVDVLGAAVCEWAGIPAENVPRGTFRQLAQIVDGFGSVGPRNVRARRARRAVNRWATRLIVDVRIGAVPVPQDCPLAVVAQHRDAESERRLPERTAAVELLNLLRPTVAVAWLITYAALMLVEHPELAEPLHSEERLHGGARDDDLFLEAFALEVRRCCPFVPALGATARTDFTWSGHRVARGQLVILDVYGTDHDPAIYPEAYTFDPGRFLGVTPGPYGYLPQGGGDVITGHRCPGERVAIEALKVFTRALIGTDHAIPAQDLSLSLSRVPARVHDGLRLCPHPGGGRP